MGAGMTWAHFFGSEDVPPGTTVVILNPHQRLNGLDVTGDLVIRMHDFSSVTCCNFLGKVRFEARSQHQGINIFACSLFSHPDSLDSKTMELFDGHR